MIMLMNYNLKENMRLHFVLKIINLVFLIWIYHPYVYKCDLDRILHKKSKQGSIVDIDFKRLLAQYEFKKQLYHSSLSENLPGYSKFKEIKNDKYISTYGHLKKGKANELDAYKKKYKYRYDKKKGLAKLDCYCEKKVFDKIENMYDLAEKYVGDKKSYKKEMYRKYGKVLFTFALLPLLGLVIPVVFGRHNPLTVKWCLTNCLYKHDGSNVKNRNNYDNNLETARNTHNEKGIFMASIDRDTWNIIIAVNSVITYLLIIIFLIVIIYILIKVIKYEKLKSYKGKMSVKEHYRFCKNLLK
ncbi:hypothetical protein PVNG_03106 [Plasmodium vivax North Korean]|uniref:Variable surface protein n=1 Tax=Plasmodium vivax North Korean TaxID=1035514 RepID=A0A0J9WEP1_PLAVI|nr:hypothetical protein PVNG_03106 [Plasmodium vivax North Korean]